MKKLFIVILLAFLAVSLSTVQASISGTPTLARHYDLRPLTNLSFYRSNGQLGDLNNDGRIDYLVYSNSVRMAAFADNGSGGLTKLWEYTCPVNIPEPPEKYQYKYTIWDVDADNQTEVMGMFASASGYLELRILNGATGAVEHSLTTTIANPTSSDDIMETRTYVTVANFRGLATPRDLVLLTEYNGIGEIWAYDDSLQLLWDTTGDNAAGEIHIYAHFPWTFDLDSDGRDELVGRWIFDHDGTKGAFISDPALQMWFQHIDRCHFGDFVSSNPGIEMATSREYVEATVWKPDGTQLWEVASANKDSKLIAVGEFSAANAGPEVTSYAAAKSASTNKTYRTLNGALVSSIPMLDDGGAYNIDWDGDRSKDEAFCGKWGGKIYDPVDGSVIDFGVNYYPVDAYTQNPALDRVNGMVCDVYGDNREEIILVDDDEILVYTNSAANSNPQQSPYLTPFYKLMIANEMNDTHPERAFWPSDGTPPPPPPPSGPFYDGFESGDFTTGGWLNSACTISSKVKYAGTYSAQFNSSDTLTKSSSTTGYGNVTVEYVRTTVSFTSTTHFIAEWYNGSTWTVLEDITGTVGWTPKSFALPAEAANNPNFQLRFRVAGTGSRNYAYLDEVRINVL